MEPLRSPRPAVGAERRRLSILVFTSSALFVGMLCALARVTGSPFLFPALGATAFLLVSTPDVPTSSPKNVIGGYALAIICGYLPLLLFGLSDAPQDPWGQLSLTRTAAIALALGSTGVSMIVTNLRHPAASAATVMIALGVMTKPVQLAVVELAVVALVVMNLLFHRAVKGLGIARD